jgi:hypothetical protein
LKSDQGNNSRDPISKIPSTKRADGVAQVVELLPNKCKVLSSNPSAAKKKKKRPHHKRGNSIKLMQLL